MFGDYQLFLLQQKGLQISEPFRKSQSSDDLANGLTPIKPMTPHWSITHDLKIFISVDCQIELREEKYRSRNARYYELELSFERKCSI